MIFLDEERRKLLFALITAWCMACACANAWTVFLAYYLFPTVLGVWLR